MNVMISIQSHQVQMHTQRWRQQTQTEALPLGHADHWENALRSLLETQRPRHNVSVYVGAPHVQWMVEPWPTHMPSRTAFLAYLDYQANQTLPAAPNATEWVVGLGARARCGDTAPIALISANFLAQLKTVIHEHQQQLCAVQPLIQQALEQRSPWVQQQTQDNSHVLACVEHEWLTLFGLQHGQWSSVRAMRIQGTHTQEVTQQATQYALSLGINPQAVTQLAITG